MERQSTCKHTPTRPDNQICKEKMREEGLGVVAGGVEAFSKKLFFFIFIVLVNIKSGEKTLEKLTTI